MQSCCFANKTYCFFFTFLLPSASLDLKVPNKSEAAATIFSKFSRQVHCNIDLVTVFDAILTSRQTREKLQCLYENLMSNSFRKTAVMKKISIVN